MDAAERRIANINNLTAGDNNHVSVAEVARRIIDQIEW
jgi:hypothetical protein